VHAGVERKGTGGELGGGVGVGEAAAEGPAIADRGVRHVPDRTREERRVPCDVVRTLDLGMPHQRADVQPGGVALAFEAYGTQFLDAPDVDKHVRRGQTHVERRHEALPSGDDRGVRPVAVQQIERLIERSSPGVADVGCLHVVSVGAARPAYRSFGPLRAC